VCDVEDRGGGEGGTGGLDIPRERSMIGDMAKMKRTASERVFSGVYSTGISYADKDVEVHGDYKKLAFLPFSTLVLEWYANRVPPDVREYIDRDAAKMQARRGQQYAVSSSGQTVTLGSGGGGGDSGGGGSGGKSKSQLEREIKATVGKGR
jgi:uncharacterized membrane protein YgcG